MEYQGYKYVPEVDEEEDNRKIFHIVETPEGVTTHIDWSPYSKPSREDFEGWIDLGMPTRHHPALVEAKKSGGSLNSESLDLIAGLVKMQANPEPLLGKSIMITGKFPGHTRKELQAIIEKLGGYLEKSSQPQELWIGDTGRHGVTTKIKKYQGLSSVKVRSGNNAYQYFRNIQLATTAVISDEDNPFLAMANA